MMRFVLLILSTILTLFFLILLFRGRRFDPLLEGLTGDEYTLSELYGVGMLWQEMVPALDYTGDLGQSIGKSIELMYTPSYREYYTRVILAKAYTFLHFGACVSFLLGTVLFSDATAVLVAVGGTAASFIAADQALKRPAEQVAEMADDLTIALPNLVTKLALLINSGMILREAWFYVAKHSSGVMAQCLVKSCEQMENGYSEVDAIYNFGNASTSKEMKKLASVLVQGIEKGNAELSALLSQQAAELWATKRQKMLQRGEAAATKLILPTMLMFGGLILVVVVSSIGGLSL